MGHLTTARIFTAQNMMKRQGYVLKEMIAPSYTEQQVTQKEDTTCAITKLASASMRQTLRVIVPKMVSTAPLPMVPMISAHQYMT
ncbi:unnamed protein product [Ranitomeya imitator]|uniref:Uncharacterized protein n=1 Tax=Ranitomeya imitator TaxID=111125 RepID=A0ABN9M0E7_9NEOB|nr:unnamed protein product [Ranitomeya imitator]